MFKRGKWQIEIDAEKTKEYYASLPVPDTQSARNFRKNIDFFTAEERAFFDTFCIDLTKLNVEGTLTLSPILKKKREWDCNADIFYYGKVLSAPSIEDMITIEDVAENGIDILDERDDLVVTVGRFAFEIQSPEDWEQVTTGLRVRYIYLCRPLGNSNGFWMRNVRTFTKRKYPYYLI